ncbi:MAG: hypothetical protein AABX33_08590 [Nanoarchaeota archaeon]
MDALLLTKKGFEESAYFLKNPLGFLIISFPTWIAVVCLGFIFRNSWELNKKRKYIWLVIIATIVIKIAFVFVLGAGLGALSALVIGIIESVSLVLMGFFLLLVLKLEESKQNFAILISLIILLILNIVQYFGYLRYAIQYYI